MIFWPNDQFPSDEHFNTHRVSGQGKDQCAFNTEELSSSDTEAGYY